MVKLRVMVTISASMSIRLHSFSNFIRVSVQQFSWCVRPFDSVVGAAGDLVGPGMFEDHLTTLNTARVYSGSGEGYVYEFAVNLQTLNYLQTINLLDQVKLHATLEFMQTSTTPDLNVSTDVAVVRYDCC